MKKPKSIYFFFFLFGIVSMLIAMTVIFVDSSTYIYLSLVVFGIIATLVVVSIKLSNGTYEQRAKRFKECLICSQEINGHSSFCEHCGSPQPSTVICEYCGKENTDTDAMCQHCNALLK